MIFWAAKIICSRIIDPPFKLFSMIFTTMLFTYTILNVLCMSVFLNLEAWYAPQFFITIGGMIIGNSMNALALSLERLF